MKKRSPKKLTVSRETLHHLEENERRIPQGASGHCTSIPCFMETQCGSSCPCW